MGLIIDILKSISFGAIILTPMIALCLFSIYSKYGWVLLSAILFIIVSFIIGDTYRNLNIKNKEE